ncbi:hypothetical protein ACA910_008691 [Epithemia clementina (nom. ined.)]
MKKPKIATAASASSRPNNSDGAVSLLLSSYYSKSWRKMLMAMTAIVLLCHFYFARSLLLARRLQIATEHWDDTEQEHHDSRHTVVAVKTQGQQRNLHAYTHTLQHGEINPLDKKAWRRAAYHAHIKKETRNIVSTNATMVGFLEQSPKSLFTLGAVSTTLLFRVLPSDPEYQSRKWDAQPYVMEQYKLVFFTTPKVSCSTWKILFRKMTGLYQPNDTDDVVHNPYKNNLRLLGSYSLEEASAMFLSDEWTRAMFVRDPIERFLSAYLDKVVHTDYAVRHCCSSKSSIVRDRRCVSNLKESLEKALPIMEQCNDPHWALQSDRISAKYQTRLNFIGNLDSIQQDSEALLRRIGAWDEFGKTGWGQDGMERIFTPRRHSSSALALSSLGNPPSKQGLTTSTITTRTTKTTTASGGNTMLDGQRHSTHAANKVSQYIYSSPHVLAQLLDYYRVDYESPIFKFTKPKVLKGQGHPPVSQSVH